MNDYEKKQRRKAYVLFFVRMHSETARKARLAYRAGLLIMLAMMLGMDFYAWATKAYAILCVLVLANKVLLVALWAS